MKDYGIGINAEDQRNLFKPYFRATDTTSREMNASSHGLGLSICKMISVALNGDLKVESELRVGTKFTFTFDAEKIIENVSRVESSNSNVNIQ